MAIKSYKNKLADIQAAIEAASRSGGGSFDDDDLWKPTIVGGKKTTYIVRFLPQEELATGIPWISFFMHYVEQPNGSKFARPCPTTIGNRCPICDDAYRLYKSPNPFDAKRAKAIYKRKTPVANILVRQDDRDDGINVGRVMKWKYGYTIEGILKSAIEDDHLVFWDLLEGYDLRVVLTPKGEWSDYSSTAFVHVPSPVADVEEAIRAILDKCFDLPSEFLAESKFLEYGVLKAAYDKAMGTDVDALPDEDIENTTEAFEEAYAKNDTAPAMAPGDVSTEDVDDIEKQIAALSLDEL